MKLLDLFCGMGGWSIGFHREGFYCEGLDIVDVGYPYALTQMDIGQFHAIPQQWDVVVASPPCTEFSRLTELPARNGQRPWPDPEKGMVLVREAKRIIRESRPKYWVIENVAGSVNHIRKELGPPTWIIKPWYLWGNLPPFLAEIRKTEKIMKKRPNDRTRLGEDFPFDPMRSWKHARIPLPLSQSIARACKEALYT